MLTIQDIKKRQFTRKLRGYDTAEVAKFIGDVLVYITFLKKELNRAQEEVSSKENELKKAEENIRELMDKAQDIKSAIAQQDEVNDSLKEENGFMFKKLEKYGTQLEILKRENSDLESKNKSLSEEFEALNEENTQLKESIDILQADVEKYSLENKKYSEKINEYIEREDSIKEIMFLAKKTADEIIKKAETEGKNIVINAEEQEALLMQKIKILENRIIKMKKDFSEVINHHAVAFENEINNIDLKTD